MSARKNTAEGSNQQDLFAVSSNNCCCDHSEGLINRLKRHGRFNRVLSILLAFIMIMGFFLIRKRQVLRRVLANILKLAHKVAKKPWMVRSQLPTYVLLHTVVVWVIYWRLWDFWSAKTMKTQTRKTTMSAAISISSQTIPNIKQIKIRTPDQCWM